MQATRRIRAVSDRPWLPSQVGLSNEVVRFGFTALPWLDDRLVGPLFHVAAQDLTREVTPDNGNVLTSRPSVNGLHEHQGNALLGAAPNVAMVLRQRRGVQR